MKIQRKLPKDVVNSDGQTVELFQSREDNVLYYKSVTGFLINVTEQKTITDATLSGDGTASSPLKVVGGGGGGETLAATLLLGNTTGATDIVITDGQVIESPTGGWLNLADGGPKSVGLTTDGPGYQEGWVYLSATQSFIGYDTGYIEIDATGMRLFHTVLEAPYLTTALIDSGGVKTLITKEWYNAQPSNTTFTGLSDTPATILAADANKFVRVNPTFTGLEFLAGSAINISEFNNDSGYITSAPTPSLSTVLATGNTTGANTISIDAGLYLTFNTGTAGSRLNSVPTTSMHVWSLPDSTGTIALTSDIHAAVTLGGVANDTTDDTLDLTGQVLTVNLATITTDGAMSSADKIKADATTPANIPTSDEKAALVGQGTPTGVNPYTTKTYVDGLVATGSIIKEAADLATDAALPANTAAGAGVGKTLTADAVGILTVDGVATVLGDRILVKDETPTSDNGIYDVTTEGTAGVAYVLTRATDYDNTPLGEVDEGTTVYILGGGTANAFTGWRMDSPDVVTIDTDPITFLQFQGLPTLSHTQNTDTGTTSLTWIIDSGGTNGIATITTASLTGPQTFTLPNNTGTVALTSDIVTDTLATTLAAGFTTGANNISINSGQSLIYNNGAFTATINEPTLAGNIVLTLPALTGTIALTSELSAYLPLAGGVMTGAVTMEKVTFSTVVEAAATGTSFVADLATSNVFDITMTGAYTLDYSNATIGTYVFHIKGAFTLSFAATKFEASGGVAPIHTADSVLTGYYDGAKMKLVHTDDFQSI